MWLNGLDIGLLDLCVCFLDGSSLTRNSADRHLETTLFRKVQTVQKDEDALSQELFSDTKRKNEGRKMRSKMEAFGPVSRCLFWLLFFSFGEKDTRPSTWGQVICHAPLPCLTTLLLGILDVVLFNPQRLQIDRMIRHGNNTHRTIYSFIFF